MAAHELSGAIRVWQPLAALALGRLDLRKPGAAAALEVARRAGLAAVRRLSGGHAVLLGKGSLCIGVAEPAELFEGSNARYRRVGGAVETALAAFGVVAQSGELEGEWCPGAWSIRAGRVKLAGLAQRAIAGAAWTEAVVALAPLPRERAILAEVYAALELPFDVATVGSLSELHGAAVPFGEFAGQLVARLAPDRRPAPSNGSASAATLARASELAGAFRVAG